MTAEIGGSRGRYGQIRAVKKSKKRRCKITAKLIKGYKKKGKTTRKVKSGETHKPSSSCIIIADEDNKIKTTTKPSSSSTSIIVDEEIDQGDVVDISDLLFTKDRDFLISNTGKKVKAHELKGKFVLICLMNLQTNYKLDLLDDLLDIYRNLEEQDDGFEVVFVAFATTDGLPSTNNQDGPQECFTKIFQDMPWLAVPYDDAYARQRIHKRFGGSSFDCFPLLDSTGKVLYSDARYTIQRYGLEGFPFSYERIQEVYCQDEEDFQQLDLVSLLGSPDRDFLINNGASQVLINTLEHKVVGLYFFENHSRSQVLLTKIKKTYEYLKIQNKDFEIVLVCLHSDSYLRRRIEKDEESFWKSFRTMPWLALPFKDPSCRRLQRIFNYEDDGGPSPTNPLVIIGPHGKYVEFYGADILEKYGIDAYPYTRDVATDIETQKLMLLKLDSLFHPRVVLRGKDRIEVPLSGLSGKRVIVFIATNIECLKTSSCAMMLRRMYDLNKGKDDEFEVICVAYDEATYNYCIQELPWLVHPFLDYFTSTEITRRLFVMSVEYAVVAFERNGEVVGKESNVKPQEIWSDTFPYIDMDLRKQTFIDLCFTHLWYYQYVGDEAAMLDKLGFVV